MTPLGVRRAMAKVNPALRGKFWYDIVRDWCRRRLILCSCHLATFHAKIWLIMLRNADKSVKFGHVLLAWRMERLIEAGAHSKMA
jgi:hypothetical protein